MGGAFGLTLLLILLMPETAFVRVRSVYLDVVAIMRHPVFPTPNTMKLTLPRF